jgi:predicted metal-binding membrane protein
MTTALRPAAATARPGPRAALVVLAGLVVVAWAALVVWARSPAAGYLDHDGLAHPDVRRVGLLAAAWLLMAVAMMLPASLPYVSALLAGRRDRRRVVALAALVGGFVAVWVAFGVVLTTGDLVLHHAVEASGWVGQRAWLVFPVTLVAAGAYELSRSKRRALDRCRHPADGVVLGATAGRRHGVDCVGACGGLMVVVFALGMTNLVAMAVGTVVTVLERFLGTRVVLVVGVALVAAAVVARTGG